MTATTETPERRGNVLRHDTSEVTPVLSNRTPEERFWSKVDRSAGPDGCWPWLGAVNSTGYGLFNAGHNRATNRRVMSHRYAYELANGSIPAGARIDHLCRSRACVNASHLEAVTHQENVLRGLRGRMVTHCPKGHEYTPENTVLHHGRRECRECMRERDRGRHDAAYWRAYRAKKKAQA